MSQPPIQPLLHVNALPPHPTAWRTLNFSTLPALQMSKAPIQAFADRVSAVFVPVVVALALLTWAVW